LGPERRAALEDLFRDLEFQSLARRLDELAEGPAAPAPPAELIHVQVEPIAPEGLALRLAGSEGGLAVAVAGGGWGRGAGPAGEGADAALAAALDGRPVAAHDFKALPEAVVTRFDAPAHDTEIGAYLLEPRRRSYDLDELAEEAGLGADAEDPAVRGAALVAALAPRQAERIRAEGLDHLFPEGELPLTPGLADMERARVELDTHRLREIAARVRDRADELRDQIWELAGGEFVIDSPKQLGQVLFERLGLPTFRRAKTGWSTDRRVLRLLEDRHPIVRLIGEYRELTKL